MEENFTSDDMFYMVRCPKCGKENHGFFVAEGRCAWCGNDEATVKQKAWREHNKEKPDLVSITEDDELMDRVLRKSAEMQDELLKQAEELEEE